MTTRVVLHHFPPSLCSQKVRLALCEKGVTYTSKLVNIGPPMENYEPWYARINAGLVVPTLVIDDEPITDSARIIKEIDRRFDGPDLAATDKKVVDLVALQDGLKIREIAYGENRGLIGFLTKGTFEKRIQVLERHQRENPDLAEIYERRIEDIRAWRAVSTNKPAIETLKAKLEDTLNVVAARLGSSKFLVANRYTLADVTWTVILARLKLMGLTHTWRQERPELLAYYECMHQRESFDAADVWERLKVSAMAPIIWRVTLARLGLRR